MHIVIDSKCNRGGSEQTRPTTASSSSLCEMFAGSQMQAATPGRGTKRCRHRRRSQRPSMVTGEHAALRRGGRLGEVRAKTHDASNV